MEEEERLVGQFVKVINRFQPTKEMVAALGGVFAAADGREGEINYFEDEKFVKRLLGIKGIWDYGRRNNRNDQINTLALESILCEGVNPYSLRLRPQNIGSRMLYLYQGLMDYAVASGNPEWGRDAAATKCFFKFVPAQLLKDNDFIHEMGKINSSAIDYAKKKGAYQQDV